MFAFAAVRTCRHPHELPKRSGEESLVELHMCTRTMGLGGDMSWEPKVCERLAWMRVCDAARLLFFGVASVICRFRCGCIAAGFFLGVLPAIYR